MNRFIVCLDLARPTSDHPVLQKLAQLQALHVNRSLWFVEYPPGGRMLQDFLSASLYESEGLLVHHFDRSLLGTYARVGQAWIAGERPNERFDPSYHDPHL